MAPPTRTGSLRLIEPSLPRHEDLEPITVDVPSNEIAPGVSIEDGTMHIEHGDGSTTIDFDPPATETKAGEGLGFYRNLVNEIDNLDDIANQLMDGIQRDIDSRQEWLETRAQGIKLLGLKLEEPRSDIGTSSAPLEGMSTVRHPLLLEATVRFQATARGELLPSGGPVKVRNDTPPKQPSQSVPPVPAGNAGAGSDAMSGSVPAPGTSPPAPAPSGNPAQDANPLATEVAQPEIEEVDTLADALETDFNHYLTSIATEYVPDTDRMLFYIGFGGDGFKKVYNCPLRRRPVSESVDAENLIVSDSATDLKNCGRVTHKIKMRKSIVRRMQLLGVYADIELQTPQPSKMDAVKEQKQEIEGTNESAKKPEDLDYELYECYCELDLDKFAPKQFKDEALPLPYRVTIETKSRKILSIIRNWKEDDEQCLPKQFFVQFPFIRGLGFYGYGFVHVLGNTTAALTAMWREMLDAGMFSNFPGFITTKSASRQLSNQFRVPVGGSVALDVPLAGGRIQDHVMPIPYKEPGSGFVAFGQWVEQAGQRLGQTAEVSVGEGKQDAPVGTTLALIEQATKLLDSVHKRLHASQAEEFALLKERFKEDPEAFWRHKNKSSMKWEKEGFLKALENYNLVPVADPNNPTSLHRAAKAQILEGLLTKYPQQYIQRAVLKRVHRVVGIDEEGLFFDSPLPPPPDPRMAAIQQKAQSTTQATQAQAQAAIAKTISTLQLGLAQIEAKAQDRASKENIERVRAQAQVLQKLLDHRLDQQQAETDRIGQIQDIHIERAKAADQMAVDRSAAMMDMQTNAMGQAQELRSEAMAQAHDLAAQRQAHLEKMQQQREAHQQTLEQKRELHAMELEHKRALAAATKKSNNKAKSGDS